MRKKMYLILITGNDCGGCMQMKRNGVYDRFIQAGRNNPLITKVMEISQASRHDDIPRKYPAFIQTRLKMWVPLIFIISKHDFDSANSENPPIQNVEVFSGKIGYNDELRKVTVLEDTSFKYGYNSISEWMNNSTRVISEKLSESIRTEPAILSRSRNSKKTSRSIRTNRNESGENAKKRRTHVCRSTNRVIPKY